jgi:hypothetical protein
MKRGPEALKAALSEGFSYYRENQNAGLCQPCVLTYIYLLKMELAVSRQGGKPLPAVGKSPIDQLIISTYSSFTMIRSAFINRRKYNER